MRPAYHPRTHLLVLFLLCLLPPLFPGLTLAAGEATALGHVATPVVVSDTGVAEQRTQLEQLRAAIAAFDITSGARQSLGEWHKGVGAQRTLVQKGVSEHEQRLEELKRRLEQLGSSEGQDDPEVLQAHATLTQTVRDQEKRLAAWKSLAIGIQETQETLARLEAEVVRVRVFGRGIDLLQVIDSNLQNYDRWWPETLQLIRTSSGIDILSSEDFFALLLSALFGLGIGWMLRAYLQGLYRTPPEGDLGLALMHAVPACLARFAPAIGATLAALAFLAYSLPLTPLPLVTQAVIAYGLYLLLALGVRLLFDPVPPASHYLPLDVELSRSLARRLKMLMFLFVVGFLLFASPFGYEMPEMQRLLLRAVYFGFIVVNLIWTFWLLGTVSALGHTLRLRGLLSVFFVVALVAEWIGYRNLSLYLLGGLLGTVTGTALTLFFGQLANNLFDGLDSGRLPWEQRLRSRLKVPDNEPFPGLIWLRLLASIGLWMLLGYWLLILWGLSDRGIALIRSLMSDGFDVGTFHIVPMQWLGGMLVFALLIGVAGWVRGQLVPNWLARTRLDRGVRDSMSTMSGYFFVLLAAVLGLATAGLDFSSLALIAGALSVGIGFGLQNVVNNFVSGLILLFERPIRVGDWIVVGNTEGYVKRISIRSTQIQTFDRADVIVPNSELIASQVTNWMLRDPWGRVIVPIGVAYGSDPEEVRDILLRVAKAHPECLTDGNLVSPPRVVFQGFGDNSIDFELRLFIRNIDAKVTVRSDLNYAIERELRAAGIAIPFPQRDVHLNLVLGDGKSVGLEELRALLHGGETPASAAPTPASDPQQDNPHSGSTP